MARTSTGSTPFSYAFGTKAVIPVKQNVISARVEHLDEEQNNSMLPLELDLLNERRDMALLRLTEYQ